MRVKHRDKFAPVYFIEAGDQLTRTLKAFPAIDPRDPQLELDALLDPNPLNCYLAALAGMSDFENQCNLTIKAAQRIAGNKIRIFVSWRFNPVDLIGSVIVQPGDPTKPRCFTTTEDIANQIASNEWHGTGQESILPAQ